MEMENEQKKKKCNQPFDGVFDYFLGKQFVVILLIIGIVIIIGTLIIFHNAGYSIFGNKNNFDLTATGQFGTFIGGVVGIIFALAGTVLIYMTFRNQFKFNKSQSKFNKSQSKFNKSQQFSNEINAMWQMTNDIAKNVKEFNEKSSTIKLGEKLNNANRDDLWGVYDDMSFISNLCFLAYEFNKVSSLPNNIKKTFWLTFWLHSKNVASYWGYCSEENKNYIQKEDDNIKMKEDEINNYIDKLNEFI